MTVFRKPISDCIEFGWLNRENFRADTAKSCARRMPARLAGGVMLCLLLAGFALADDTKTATATTYQHLDVDQWIEKLDDEDKESRRRAAYALGQIGPPAVQAVPALIKVADDKQLEVGWYALDALGRIGPAARDAVPGIVEIVEKSADYATLRLSGIRALGRIGVSEGGASSAIESALKDGKGEIRVAAALALWQLDRRASAIDALAAELDDSSAEVAFSAATALAQLGGDAAPADRALMKALGHDDSDVRRAAGRALSHLGMPVVTPLLKSLQYSDRFNRLNVIQTLGWIVETHRRDVLERPELTEREYLQAAVPLHRDVVPALVKIFDDDDAGVRNAAVKTVGRMGPLILPFLLDTLQSGSVRAREGAAGSLAEMQSFLRPASQRPAGVQRIVRSSMKKLIDALSSDDRTTREAAFRLFDAIQPDRQDASAATAALRDGLRDENVMIRRYAARSLERFSQQP